MSDTDITVVSSVLNWNSYEDTAVCLKGLFTQSGVNHEIVVVDNGSTDNSGDRIRSEFTDVEVIQSQENRGFSGGHNLVIRHAMDLDADYVWLLNNDVVIHDTLLLRNLVEEAESTLDTGVISPLVFRYPDTDKIWFGRGDVDVNTGSAHHNKVTTRERLITNTDYIPFCAALFPTAVFHKVGLLPEEYFLYLEDADFCQQLTKAGYELVIDSNQKLYHKGSASSGGKVSPTMLYYLARNRWTFARKWGGKLSHEFYCRYFQWSGLQFARCVYHSRLSAILALLRGALDGKEGRTGKGPFP